MEAEIGEAAGKIWQALNTGGPMRKSAISKATGLPSGVLNQGIGWLAREANISSEGREKKQVFKLKS